MNNGRKAKDRRTMYLLWQRKNQHYSLFFVFLPLCVVGLLLAGFVGHVPDSFGAQEMPSPSDHGQHEKGHLQMVVPGQWEGSAEGIAFSEFNHALAGLMAMLVGLSELRLAVGWQGLAWSRWLLPGSLLGFGVFLMIWSDHDAWPIGSLTLQETLSGNDPEMLQHKFYALFCFAMGTVELLRRLGTLKKWFWGAILPGLTLVAGVMLFIHMHGPHPAGHQIQVHHNIMGTLALAGGCAWFAAELIHKPSGANSVSSNRSVLKILWALFVVAIGVQLFLYSES